ncbi:MAG: hypothetical protein IJU76_15345 [Desulfovibrionaceae bacterium]|nr:hypothetical protein [Desulfovibrionaceae bacterium]
MRVREFTLDHAWFRQFLLRKECNQHSLCHFRMTVQESDLERCVEKIGTTLCVTLDDGRPIFYGRIQEITQEQTFACSYIEVKALADTVSIDEQPHTRIFQNPEKTFGDVLNDDRLKLGKVRLSLDAKLRAMSSPNVILQARETDFAFLCRMAASVCRRVWVVDTNEGVPALRIGYHSSDSDSVTRLDPESVLKAAVVLTKTGKRRLHLVTREYIEIGRKVHLGEESRTYLVTSLELKNEHGLDRFALELEEYAQIMPDTAGTAQSKVARILARVTNIQDPKNLGRIQVRFDKEQTEDEDTNQIWIPYRPPYGGRGGGIVFLPDVDDLVEVHFEHGTCFAATTFRKHPLDEECRKVEEKYIGNNFGRRIFWKKDTLEIFSGENRIVLDDKSIELIVGENRLRLDADGIVLKTPQNNISLTKDAVQCAAEGDILAKSKKNCLLQGKETAELKGNELKLLADVKAQLQGSKVNVKGSGTVKISGSRVSLC